MSERKELIISSPDDAREVITEAWEIEDNTQLFSIRAKQFAESGIPISGAITLSVLQWLEEVSKLSRGERSVGEWVFEELHSTKNVQRVAGLAFTFGFFTTFGFCEYVVRTKIQDISSDTAVMEAFEHLDDYAELLAQSNEEVFKKGRDFFRESAAARAETYIQLSADIQEATKSLEEDERGLTVMAMVVEYFLKKSFGKGKEELQLSDFAHPINNPKARALLREDPILMGSVYAINLYGRIYGNGFASKEELDRAYEDKANRQS